MASPELQLGACYSNGDFGRNWAVRQVVDLAEGERVRYKVVVGEQRRKVFECHPDDFADWARYRVVRNENSWERA